MPKRRSPLRFERVGNHLKVSNASPYYVTLVNLVWRSDAGKPDGRAEKLRTAGAANRSEKSSSPVQSVNDYGAIYSARSVNL